MSAISVSWLEVLWDAVNFETNYGLMQHSYIEIKNKLLRALDSEYNVVDMATVFEVVAVLEKAPITSEILETTRLGKLINDCRRHTDNEALARRAKLLVRQWQSLLTSPSEKPATVVNNLSLVSTTSSNSCATASTSSLAALLPSQQNGIANYCSSGLKSEELQKLLREPPPPSSSKPIFDERILYSPEPSPPPSTPKPITDEDVERYLNEPWDGVNGCFTHTLPKDEQDTGFREWNEMVARRTSDDVLINILPYCVVD